MKIAVLALCVVLPSICLCTPLPDYSATAGSNSAASVTAPPGSNITAGSNSSSNVSINNPPAVPPTTTVPTPPPTSQPPPPDAPPPCTGGDSPAPPPPPPCTGGDSPAPPPPPPCTGGDSPTPPPPTPTPSGDNTTVNASSKSDANVNVQPGGNGGPSVSANASSNASVSVTTGGHKCGKGDVNGFDKYTVVVKSQEDYQRLSTTWMLWKSSSSTTKIDYSDAVCFPRHLDQNCKYSQFKITVQSETEIYYEAWGSGGQKTLYMKQKMTLTSQQYHIYSTQVLTVSEVTNGSQEVIAVQNEQSIKAYFENDSSSFAILDYSEDYMVCQTSSGVTFISVSQKVYESDDLKQQISQKIDQVLKINNIQSSSFIEVSSKVDIDITKYKWDQCSQGGSGNNNAPGTDVNAKANSSSSVDVKDQGNNSPGGDKTNIKAGAESNADVTVTKDSNGNPTGGDKTNIKAGADSKAHVDVTKDSNGNPTGGDKTDIKAGAESKANVDVKDNNGQGSDKNGNSGGDSGSGGTGKPTQQGFTNYSVLKISNDEFKCKIAKTTWYVAKYTQVQEEVKTDVTVCADRYICSSCFAVKFQYTDDKGCFVLKEWGYDGTSLLYIQEKITFSTQDFVILKAEVVNVMKATKDTNVAVGVDNKDQVTSYLSSEYAVLYTDYKNFFIGQTSCDKGAYTFVAFIQEIYECEEKQQQFAEQISKILKENGIDESKLQKLTKKFDVDTNKYNKVKQETNVSPDGKTTQVKQETEHDGSGGKTKTETSVTNGPSPPDSTKIDANASSKSDVKVDTQGPTSSPDGTKIDANASSNAGAKVDTTQGTPSPSGDGTNVNVNTSSDSKVNVNSGGSPPPCNSPPPPSPPPCTDSPTPSTQPPSPPPASPPPTTSPPSTINANASSDSNATINSTGGNVTADANSSSNAAVTANP